MNSKRSPFTATLSPDYRGAGVSAAMLWIIILLCCGSPIGWFIWQLLFNAHVLQELKFDAFRMRLLARTISFNSLAACLALILGLPVALSLGRGHGILSKSLWIILPISLLLPSLAITYGWKQFVNLISDRVEPGSGIDILRCIWTLSTWLWPIPAGVIGMSLRRLDAQIQEQALLDGRLWQVTFRALLPAIIASFCIVLVLAVQEFAVYEPSGISVLATEVRMVFDTGGFSGPHNPINQQLGFGAAIGGEVGLADQRARAAAAVAVYLPLLGIIFALALLASMLARRAAIGESLDIDRWPRSLDAPLWITLASWLVVLLAVGMPIVSMILSLKMRSTFAQLWAVYHPQLVGSLIIAITTAIGAILLAVLAATTRSRGVMLISLISFLIGGQMLAIALIRVYNQPWLSWIYNGLPMIVIAHLARFGWIALLAGDATWRGPWRNLRDISAVDGATRWQTLRRVIIPIASPLLGACALVIMALVLTEVPATVLISPQHPQPIIPMLMTWVHMFRYDAMIQVSLLLCAMVTLLGLVAVALVYIAVLRPRINAEGRRSKMRSIRVHLRSSAAIILLFFITGCGDPTEPDDIWLETGNGAGQIIYPRAIDYDPSTDCFFVCDRMARIQRLDRDGQFLNEWQLPDWKLGKPVGLSVSPDGNVYVPDTHYQRVMVYSPQGELLKQWGGMGTGPGQFIFPTDIAFDGAGHIFVSEYGDNDRISVFDPQGNYLYEIGRFGQGDGEFSRPQSLVIDGDLLYVTDACNHRINVFKTDGTFVRNMGGPGSGLGEFRFPYGLDLEMKTGHLVVCEFGNNRVQWIDKDTGEGVRTFGRPGRESGELAYPWALAVDNQGRTIIVDSGNNRLQVLSD